MPQVKSSFILNSTQPLDLRDSLTLDEMKLKGKNDVDEGHITYCKDGDDIYKGRYFIFMPSLGYNNELGYYKEFTLNDVIILADHNALKNYDATLLPTGKLVYCLSDKMMYYNRYHKDSISDDIFDNETGYFWKLVDLSSTDYISKNSDEWEKLIHDVDKLNSNEIKIFNKVDDLIKESNKNNWLYSKGQIIYCDELGSHCYNTYSQDDINNAINKEMLKGWFGYFKLLNPLDVKPLITEPSLEIFPYKDSDYNGYWEVSEKNGTPILLADINIINNPEYDARPNIKPIEYTFNKGKIDYSNYIYFPNNQKLFDYVTGDFILASLIKKDQDIELGLGDNLYYTAFNISSPSHRETPYKDPSGFDLQDRISNITSNDIIFNYTKPVWASTESTGLIQQKLIPWDNHMEMEFKLVPTIQRKQQIKTPRPIKKLYVKMLGSYAEESISKWSMTMDNDNYIYTYNDGHRGEACIKIEF